MSTEQCGARLGANVCTLETGHAGPHGHELMPGVVVGPFIGAELGPPESSPFLCDCCKAPMILYRQGGVLACTACDQRHIFGLNREHQCLIVSCLYPAWDRMTPKLQAKYVEHERARMLFHWAALHELGQVPDREFRTAKDYVELWAETKLQTIHPVKAGWLDALRARWNGRGRK